MALSLFPRRKPDPLIEAEQTIGLLKERLEAEQRTGNNNADLFLERLAELELAIEDVGWSRLDGNGSQEFSRDGLAKIVRMARLMYLKNPLINRPVEVQALYVWGQGVSIKAADEDVNAAVQAFLDDKGNKAEITSHQAQRLKEVELQVAANVFFVYFTDTATGTVRVRSIPFEEIQDLIKNPQDRNEPWFYRRVWSEDLLEGGTEQREAYYPDWNYTPAVKTPTLRGKEVRWDSPVQHVKVGGFPHWKFGISEVYAAMDWARAYKESLEDDATRSKALARLVWNLTGMSGGKRAVQAAKSKMSTTYGSGGTSSETNPAPSNPAIFIGSDGVEMKPTNLSGAIMPTDHARPLRLQVAAAVGLPETFMGDADVGNHATSKTLDRPTELKFSERQELWKAVLADMVQYVIRAKENASRDRLAIKPDEETSEPNRHVDIDFPDLLERSVEDRVKAIAAAATLDGKADANTLPRELVSRLMMQALGIDDIDEELTKMEPPADVPTDGPPLPPPEDQPIREARKGRSPKAFGRALEQLRRRHMRGAERDLANFFTAQAARVAKGLQTSQQEAQRLSEAEGDLLSDDELDRLRVVLEGIHARVLPDVLPLVEDVLGISLELDDPLTRAYLADAGELVTNIHETTRVAIASAMQAGQADGESLSELANRLKGLPAFGRPRAMLVARTELGRASNLAAVHGYRASGVVVGIEIADGDYDEACAAMNGRRFALDRAPAPLEHPNCTRALLPITDVADLEDAA